MTPQIQLDYQKIRLVDAAPGFIAQEIVLTFGHGDWDEPEFALRGTEAALAAFAKRILEGMELALKAAGVGPFLPWHVTLPSD